MMPTAIRKKGVPLVPRSTHVAAPKSKSSTPKPTPTEQAKTLEKTQPNDKARDDALALVSTAYASDVSHPMEVEEEYDPSRPNEYDRYVAERSHRLKMEREEDRDRDWDRDREDITPKAQPVQPVQLVLDLSVSGEEAFNRRARLSGRIPSPPRPTPPPTEEDEDIDGEALDAPPVPAPIPASPRESVAARMMARMGWKEGSGLGKEEQGMTTALVHKKTDRKTGIIVNAPPVAQAKPVRSVVRFPPQSEQSRVLLLKNMVGPGEVDDDLEIETATECSKYGEVVVSNKLIYLLFLLCVNFII
jgi:splicing factor 45